LNQIVQAAGDELTMPEIIRWKSFGRWSAMRGCLPGTGAFPNYLK
jgi:hypothetical protein